jgi:hypothetical protein
MKICQQIPNLGKVTQKYQASYLKTKVLFVVAAMLNHHKSTLFECYGIRLFG